MYDGKEGGCNLGLEGTNRRFCLVIGCLPGQSSRERKDTDLFFDASPVQKSVVKDGNSRGHKTTVAFMRMLSTSV